MNTTTGHVVDGHLRVEEAISAGAPEVPVLYVELTPEEEALVLATLDPMSAMAGQNDEQLIALLADVTTTDEALSEMMSKLVQHIGDEPDSYEQEQQDAQDGRAIRELVQALPRECVVEIFYNPAEAPPYAAKAWGAGMPEGMNELGQGPTIADAADRCREALHG